MGAAISRVEVIPLRHTCQNGPYGSSRGMVSSRESTLVRIHLSDGLAGVGEAFGPPLVATALVREMEPALLGLTPERALSALVRIGNQSYHKGVGLFTAAISGVDSALWDVMARAAGLSLSAMLGGRARETVTPYASTGYVRPNNSVQEFRDLLEEASHGFSGAKIKIGMGLASDLERVNAARDVLGPDRHLMLDVNGNYTADEARVLCRELEGLDVAWLEEPLPPEDRDGLARLRDFTVRLATGESLFTRFAFRDHLTQRLVDVIQPDVAKVGGVSEMRALIDMARAWNLRVSPHIWGGGVALATSLQLLAHMPDYPHATHVTSIPWLEYDRGENHLRSRLLRQPLDVRNGEVAVPDGPGIGVDLDEDFVAHARIDT